jgi:transposase
MVRRHGLTPHALGAWLTTPISSYIFPAAKETVAESVVPRSDGVDGPLTASDRARMVSSRNTKGEPSMGEITTVGIDLAKNVFQVHGVDANGDIVVRKAVRRAQVVRFFEALPRCLVGMEACATAHYWARAIAALGHEVRLMPPQYVKAYVKRNKNDAADAEAICEAVLRPSMRFVPVKSAEQQAVLMMHRARELRQRTMLVNALRAHLAEFGIVAAQGIHRVDDLVAIVADEADTRVPAIARPVLRVVADQIAIVQSGIEGINARIVLWHRSSEVSQRLAGIPGVGPIVASAAAASVPDASVFR